MSNLSQGRPLFKGLFVDEKDLWRKIAQFWPHLAWFGLGNVTIHWHQDEHQGYNKMHSYMGIIFSHD